MDREHMLDELEAVILDTHDLDVTDRCYAKAVLRWIERNTPAIKPLVWIKCGDGTHHDAHCQYELETDGRFWRVIKGVTGGTSYVANASTLDAAKAAAQADYEARIRSALVDGGGWRPIETAPKDGFFLIADFRVIDADWDCSVVVAHRDIHGGFLAYMDEEGAEIPYLDGTPTHWMPLPSPPTTEGEG